MKAFFKVTELETVFQYIESFEPVGTETVPLDQSFGRILAVDVVSDMDLPDFNRSTVDGYAVRAASTFGASEGSPAFLTLKGTVAMGEVTDFVIKSGEVASISTGGMLPEGADGVVMIEHTEPVDESTIEAPFAGTVTAVHIEPGEWASPGHPVIELAGTGAVEVVVEAPEAAWSRLAEGLSVTVKLPFVGLETRGAISNVAAVSIGPGGLFPVEVEVETVPGLAAGMAAEVSLPLEPTRELTVPLEAVLNPGSSRPAVFRITDGIAERVPVTVGQVTGDRIAVAGPLTDGDVVAVTGHTALADRDPVEVF